MSDAFDNSFEFDDDFDDDSASDLDDDLKVSDDVVDVSAYVECDDETPTGEVERSRVGQHLSLAYWAALIEHARGGCWVPIGTPIGTPVGSSFGATDLAPTVFCLDAVRSQACVVRLRGEGRPIVSYPSACRAFSDFPWQAAAIVPGAQMDTVLSQIKPAAWLVLMGLGADLSCVAVGLALSTGVAQHIEPRREIELRGYHYEPVARELRADDGPVLPLRFVADADAMQNYVRYMQGGHNG